MDETYRMLGREHEADLERHADKWRHAAEARESRRAPGLAPNTSPQPRSRSSIGARIAALRARGAPANG